MASEYEVGRIVWAKMKSYPWWPAMIEEPKMDIKRPTGKKPFHFVMFFGTDNYSWIADECVKPYEDHSKEFSKCNLASFKSALKNLEEYLASSKKKSKFKPGTSARENGDSSTSKKRPVQSSNALKTKKPKTAETDRQLSFNSSSSSTSNRAINTDHYLPSLSNEDSVSAFNEDTYDWTPRQQTSTLLCRPVVELVKSDALDMGDIVKPQPEECIPPSDLKVGFIGLGVMGSGIAKHLVSAGLHVSVWNRSPTRTFKFKDAGVAVCKTASEVVRDSDVIFSCLSDPTAVKEIVFGKYGVLETLGPGQGYVEISSIDHKTSSDIESAVQEKGARYLEAPVIGSRELCLSGQLVILAAGDTVLFDKCKPLFETFAKHAFFLGPVGDATKMNTLVNMVVGTTLASFAESMSLAEKVNISQANLLDIVKLGPLRCPLFIEKAKAMMEHNFNPSISLQHVQKDMKFALQLGHESIQPLPITAAADEVFKHAKCLGYAEHDVAAVYNARY